MAETVSSTSTPFRKWSMKRIGKGDYLLPSNDLATWWRIHRYVEDGSLQQGNRTGGWTTVRGYRWALYRAPTSRITQIVSEGNDPFDLDHWDSWEHYSAPYDTRTEAVADALRTGE